MSENRKMLGRIIRIVAALLVVTLLAFGVIRGINTRIKAAANVKQQTIDMSVPTVSVVHPKRGALKDEIVLPGNIQAFIVSPIYARTNGYLKKWYVDIGGRVNPGNCWLRLRLRKWISSSIRRAPIWRRRKPISACRNRR